MILFQGRTEKRYEECSRDGIAYHRLAVDPDMVARLGWGHNRGLAAAGRRSWRWLTARLAPNHLERAETARWRLLLTAQHKASRQALEQLAPQCLVISDGRLPNWELPLVKASQDLNIPTIVPPVALAGDRDTLTRRRSGPANHGELHPRLLRDYPTQAIWDPKQRRHVFYYPSQVLPALDSLGMLPPNPWLLGGGLAGLVLVESEQAREQRLAQGQDPGRLRVSGHLGHDILFAGYQRRMALREELVKSYGLNPGRPLAVVALPQLGEQGTLDWDNHWREIRFLAQTFRDLPAEFLISLHPKMSLSDYRFLNHEYGLRVANERLSAILPAADLFLATYSSTVPWATLCRVPALVFDFYKIDFRLFDDLPGVVTVTEREALAPEVKRILGDQRYWEALRQAQDQSAPRLSPFDGHCSERILQALVGDT
ncbi:MAG: hypothetical protein LDL07_00190 [Desulfarculus sp.]|nr:hypothetical protein [Desulfarculus sp.]